MSPTFFPAVRLGFRAVAREPWLVAVGLVVAVLRRAAVWPAFAVGWALLLRSALAALSRHPLSPLAPVHAVLHTITAPRFLALVAGLWLGGVVLGAALRVAYVAGALPTLAGALSGERAPRFATGVAFGYPRVLAAAGLGLVLDLSAGLFGGTLALAAARVTARASAGGGSPLLAAAVALALVLALAVPAALSVVADAAVARAAIRGDGPGLAFAESGARFLARPGSFLLAVLVFGGLAFVVPAAIAGAGSLATGFAASVAPALLAGPQLMIAAVAAAAAAAIDLVWLGTIAVLACGEEPHVAG